MIFVVFALFAMLVVVLLALGLLAFIVSSIVPLTLALLVGLGVSAMVRSGSPSVGVTALVTLMLFAMFRSVRQRRRPREQRPFDIEAVATRVRTPRPPPRSAEAPASADSMLDTAFANLAEHADWAGSRIAVARQSCGLFLRLADRMPYDMDAGDLAVRIRKRIPEHVGECIEQCEAATPSERRVILDEAVFTLEKVGAEAERNRVRLMEPAATEMDVQRRHLTRRSEPGPFNTE